MLFDTTNAMCEMVPKLQIVFLMIYNFKRRKNNWFTIMRSTSYNKYKRSTYIQLYIENKYSKIFTLIVVCAFLFAQRLINNPY